MSSLDIKDYKSLYFCYLLIIGVIFYSMNYFTPLYSDDWHYNFIYGTHDQIHSLKDILYSQYRHYFLYNGRFIPHFFVQLFDSLLGKQVFNVVNALVFVCFLHLLSSSSQNGWKDRFVSLCISSFLIIIIIDAFDDEFLWMSGACNYLWTGTFLLLFDRLLYNRNIPSYCSPVLIVFGFLCGWTNEAIVIGFASGYLLMIWYERKRLTSLQIWMLIAFFLGSCFLVFSPGTYHRFEESNIGLSSMGTYFNAYFRTIISMFNLRIFPLLLSLITLIGLCKKKCVKNMIADNKFIFISLIISILFIVFTKQGVPRCRFGIELFSLILLLKMLSVFNFSTKLLHMVNLSVILICSYSLVNYNRSNYEEYKDVVNQLESKNELILTKDSPIPAYFKRFIVNEWTPKSDLYFAYNKDNIRNRIIAHHFGVESIFFIPNYLYKDIQLNPDRYEHFTTYSNLPYYIKKYDKGKIQKIYFVLKETNYNELPFYIKPFAKKLSRYSAQKVEASKYYAVVNIDGESYAIVNKNLLIDSRLKEIIVE